MPNEKTQLDVSKNSGVEKTIDDKATGKPILEDIFKEKDAWDTHKEVVSALKAKGYEVKLHNVRRWLAEIGAVKDKKIKKWVLGKDYWAKKNLEILEKCVVENGGIVSSKAQSDFLIAVFKTEKHCNQIIANKMRLAFEDEIVSTICPNDEDIIVFYSKGEVDSNEDSQKDRLLEEIKRIESITSKQRTSQIKMTRIKTIS